MRSEPYPRWVRGRLGGATVVDSRRTQLVWAEGKRLPVYAFPEEDVRLDLIPAEAVSARGELVHVWFSDEPIPTGR